MKAMYKSLITNFPAYISKNFVEYNGVTQKCFTCEWLSEIFPFYIIPNM